MIDGSVNTSIPYISDSLFNSIAGSVIFKVNRTELNLSDPFIKQLDREVIPYANSHDLKLQGIVLRGAASPEGPYRNNVRLSKGRAGVLRNFITERLQSVSDSLFEANTVAEDYIRLLWILERDNDPAAPVLRRIIDECGADNHYAIKQALRSVDGGRTWWRLLHEVFPTLRSARIVIFLKQPRRSELQILPSLPPAPLAISTPVAIPDMPTMTIMPERKVERQHMLSVSSNLLYDAFYMPQYGWAPVTNIGVEYYPKSGKLTYRAAMMFPYYHRWSRQRFFQIRDYHLEVRRYFNPGFLHTGHYLALYINATKYGIGLGKTKGWQGEGMGGSFKYGHVLPLGSGRWRLDFHVAAGLWISRYDPYVYGNPITGEENGDYYYDWTGNKKDFKRRNHQFTWLGPTEIGVTLTYDLLYRKIRKKGVSMRRYETIPY